MKLQMAKNSLFAILLRSPWWVSAAIAAAIVAIARAVLPADYVPFGAFGCLPFVVIAAMAAWRQWHSPSAARVTEILQAVSAMSWTQFSGVIEEALRRDGHTVTRHAGPGADFEAVQGGRTTLVSCKRWKAARTGIEPLRELQAAMEARESSAGTYVTLGEVTEGTRKFAADNGIRVLQAAELAQLLSHMTLAKGSAR